jgi:hypothetical protein
MRLLVNLVAVLALIWPVPLAAPVGASTAPMTRVALSHTAMHGETAAEHALAAPVSPKPIKHDSRHIPDCCIGAACFGLGLTECRATSFVDASAPSIAGGEIRLVGVSRVPDLPPPRL